MAAVAAGEREIGEQLGQPVIKDRELEPGGLLTEGA